MDLLNGLTNFGITLGYMFVAAAVLPYIDVRREWVRWAGIGFFITCGLTHADMAVSALAGDHDDVTSSFMTVNHVVQVGMVWAFVIGLWLEFVKDARDSNPRP